MGLTSDVTALMMQAAAKRTARHGDGLVFSGADLPAPLKRRVPTRHGRVRVDLYLPPGVERPPVYVHLHGGGFVMRFPKMDDFFCRFVVAEAGVAVVNVDYDVAPQVRYPVAQEQSHDVYAWLAENAGEWGLDPERLAIGGFSAGGNLAASACLQIRDRSTPKPRLQLLGVPSLDVAGDIHSKPSTVADPMIGPGLLRLVRATYFKDASRRTEPYASPLFVDHVTGLPPTVVVTAEHDALRAEGDAYAARLADAGLLVEHRVVQGRDHYFLDGNPREARAVLDVLAAHLRNALAAEPIT
ncbi:alpha/beta hydrolase [Aeromicrobium sp.]|uniref:alpha/beta hydrolase n=1 Tax=Aeromicrobium sp. TaxID=1871063 RepID=UPI0019AADEC0|nr:alpha/beta hydrolase [Aeromicrobium sp.]MBC7631740.1 alpha/beta hydrolase [Aeromicrobium sp.]